MYKLKIKEFRVNAGYSQAYMASLLNMSKSYYSDLENCKYPIKLSTLCKIAKIFNVHSSDLFTINHFISLFTTFLTISIISLLVNLAFKAIYFSRS